MVESQRRMRERLGKMKEMETAMVELKTAEQQKLYEEAVAAATIERDETRKMDQEKLLDWARTYQTEPDDRDPSKMVTHWAKAGAAADNILNKEITSINDWRATMSSTLNMCIALNKAIAGSSIEIYAQDVAPVIKKVVYNVLDRITGDPKPQFKEDLTLPKLIHNVTMDDDDKLQIASLIRSDHVLDENDLQKPLNKLFVDGIKMWLSHCGYTEDPNVKGIYRDKDGVQLLKAGFEALKAHPDHGLDVFLTEDATLIFVDAADAEPSAPRIG